MKTLLIIISLCFTLSGYSQSKISLGFESGIGSYKMTELKQFNNVVISSLPFKARKIHDFPSYYYFQPSAKIQFNWFSAGIIYSYQSSGGRISVKDYSGEFRLDTKIQAKSFGLISEFRLINLQFLSTELSFYNEVGINRTFLDMQEFFEFQEKRYTEIKNKFTSKSYYFEPGISIAYSIGRFCLRANYGYFLTFKETPLIDEKEVNLKTSGKSEIRPEWNGKRVGLSLQYLIPSN